VANLIRLAELKSKKIELKTDHSSPKELLACIYKRIDFAHNSFLNTYDEIIEKLKDYNIHIVDEEQITEVQKDFCRKYFFTTIRVRLVPLMIRKSAEMPFLPDGKTYLAVKMVKAGKMNVRYSVIQLPVSESCPRFVVLPSENNRKDIIFLDDIIRMFLDDMFFMFNYDTISAHSFKIMRDGELIFDDDIFKGFVEKIEQGIVERTHNKVIRLVYDKNLPHDFLRLLIDKFELNSSIELEAGGKYHMLRDLMKFPKLLPELENRDITPLFHKDINPCESIIKVIKKQDILLTYPYQTFRHLLDFLREAAMDPRVESIFITLYRTAEHSKVINALQNAAKNGKNVVVVIELKARFDEENNIDTTAELHDAGVKVIHSIEMLKVHSKLLLIERREGKSESKGYLYIGTGNFNEKTAEVYSDFGLFTSHQELVKDARKVFDFLANTYTRHGYKHLLVSPYYMRKQIETLLDNEIKHAKAGKEAYFYAKFNSLTDEKMILRLYKASQAGVKIRLMIRGACCLQSQIKKLSENIEVRSIVDKYLEHARMMIFCNNNKPKSYILSADLMTRNLDRRIEVGVPVFSKQIHDTLCDIFEIQWQDNVKSRTLINTGEYIYVENAGIEPPIQSQDALYEYFKLKNE
jgi:polyphosphate kinase